jgi:hypothetical protein
MGMAVTPLRRAGAALIQELHYRLAGTWRHGRQDISAARLALPTPNRTS